MQREIELGEEFMRDLEESGPSTVCQSQEEFIVSDSEDLLSQVMNHSGLSDVVLNQETASPHASASLSPQFQVTANWNLAIGEIFAPNRTETQSKGTTRQTKRITTHRWLTSDEIINSKMEKEQQKARATQEKLDRQQQRQQAKKKGPAAKPSKKGPAAKPSKKGPAAKPSKQ